jgi:hypothetical protein
MTTAELTADVLSCFFFPLRVLLGVGKAKYYFRGVNYWSMSIVEVYLSSPPLI